MQHLCVVFLPSALLQARSRHNYLAIQCVWIFKAFRINESVLEAFRIILDESSVRLLEFSTFVRSVYILGRVCISIKACFGFARRFFWSSSVNCYEQNYKKHEFLTQCTRVGCSGTDWISISRARSPDAGRICGSWRSTCVPLSHLDMVIEAPLRRCTVLVKRIYPGGF